MNKGFELTKSQVSAFENGAKMFLVPILGLEETSLNQNSFPFVLNINNKYEMMTEFEVIRKLLPIQKDDENIFIKEDFWLEERGTHCPIEIVKYNIDEYYESPYTRKLLASEMTEKQSRFLIKKCVDIKIIKPNMIAKTGYFDGAYLNEDILNGKNIFSVLPNTGDIRKLLNITVMDFKLDGNRNSFNAYFKSTIKEDFKTKLGKKYVIQGKEDCFNEWWYVNCIIEAENRNKAIEKARHELFLDEYSYLEFKKMITCKKEKEIYFNKWIKNG